MDLFGGGNLYFTNRHFALSEFIITVFLYTAAVQLLFSHIHIPSFFNYRINEQNDDLAPYIKRLHFHEEDNSDLLIDLSKFKANRQVN